MGKKNEKTSKEGLKAKVKIALRPANIFESIGRIFCFFGLATLTLGFIVSFMTISSSGSVFQPTGGASSSSLPVAAAVFVAIVGILLTVGFLAYMFYWINKVTRVAIEFIATVGKTSVPRVELAMSCVLYMLAAALLVAAEPAYMLQTYVICGFGLVVALICFVVAYLIQRPRKDPKAELDAQVAKAFEK
ncbi:MAG: hypothetical protein LBG75_02935 [Candidatus Nomurabacteria bacterium]|jgi:hypothetical protein|nr:hypothetical protein [Candidatus Nomurabacteria bacterium]